MTKRAVGIELARHRAHDLLQRTALANIQPLPIEALVEYLGVELIVTRLDGANAQLIPQGADRHRRAAIGPG